ncbi:MAG: hypothetical protein ACJASG_002099 [Oleiphilaceae bacterium]|jgi:hypothetical protein
MLDILKGNKYHIRIIRKCLILIASSSIIFGCSTLKTTNDADVTSLASGSDSETSNNVVSNPELRNPNGVADTVLVAANIESSAVVEKRAEILNLEKSIQVREAQMQTIDASIKAREAKIQLLVGQIETNTTPTIALQPDEIPAINTTLNNIDEADVASSPSKSDTVMPNEVVSGSKGTIESSAVLEKKAEIQTLKKSIKANEAKIQAYDVSIRTREAEIQRLAGEIKTNESRAIASNSGKVPAMSSIEKINRLTAENPTASGVITSTSDQNN